MPTRDFQRKVDATSKSYVNGVCLMLRYTKNKNKQWIWVCDKQVITWHFVYRPLYQLETPLSARDNWVSGKALVLIMGSRVDKSGDNQNAMW